MYEIPVSDVQLDAMERQLVALWAAIDRAISADRFPARPSRLCDWCAYKDICPAWAPGDQEVAASPMR